MTQEELYWLEKRLRLKADDEERKIREKYDRWIKASEEEYRANIPYQDRLCRSPLELRLERDAKIEFARLEILEPVLDAKDNARLRRLRKEKEEEQERKKQEEERIRKEEEEERRRKEEEEKKKREEEERRLAPIREREAAERKRKEIEEQERRRKEKEKEQAEQKRKERIKTALLWLLGIVIAGGIVTAIIIFWDTILVVLKWVLIIAVIIFVLAAAGN